MTAIIGFLTGKIAGPIFAGVSAFLLIALATTWLALNWRIDDLEGERDQLRADIDTPLTGWRPRLEACQRGRGLLEADLARARTDILALEAASAAQAAQAAAAAREAQARLRATQARINMILADTANAPPSACVEILRRPNG